MVYLVRSTVRKVNISRQKREKVLRPILIWQLKRGGWHYERGLPRNPRGSRDERWKIMGRGGLKIHCGELKADRACALQKHTRFDDGCAPALLQCRTSNFQPAARCINTLLHRVVTRAASSLPHSSRAWFDPVTFMGSGWEFAPPFFPPISTHFTSSCA